MNKQPNSYFCFICGVKNVNGVHVNFYEVPPRAVDGEQAGGTKEILARFTGQSYHQGYPGRMHGGIITGILDETIGRAINIGEGEHPMTWGVTAELTVRFRKPVPLDVELTARGRITRDIHHVFEGEGEIYLPDGTVAATAHGKYVRLKLDAIAGLDPEALGWKVYAD
jgi:acyl-coenzyme A thioesterase PaaI-like protein